MNWCKREQHLCGFATSYHECMVTACIYDLRLKEVNEEIFIPMMEMIKEWENREWLQ